MTQALAIRPVSTNGTNNRLQPQDRAAHEWYRFVLSFPPHLIRDYLQRLEVPTGAVCLDPFSGTGTTLVECRERPVKPRRVLRCTELRIDNAHKTSYNPLEQIGFLAARVGRRLVHGVVYVPAAFCFLTVDMPPKSVCVIINDVQYSPPPIIQAIVARLIQDADEISLMHTGKLTFNLGEKTVKPVYEKVGETIVIAS